MTAESEQALLPVNPKPLKSAVLKVALKATGCVACVAGIVGVAYYLTHLKAPAPYDPQPIAGPLMDIDEATHLIDSGQVAAMYRFAKDYKQYLVWAAPLAGDYMNTTYIALNGVMARSIAGARNRAALWLKAFIGTFPQAPISRGLWNNIDYPVGGDKTNPKYYDPNAYNYPVLQMQDPISSEYEKPYLLRMNRETLPKDFIPESASLEKLKKMTRVKKTLPTGSLSANRYILHPAKKIQTITDEVMAKSIFAQSNVAKKLR